MGHAHRRDRDVDDVEFRRQRVDDDAGVIVVAGEQPFTERRACEIELPRAQIRDRRHGRDLNLCARERFNRPEQPMLARLR